MLRQRKVPKYALHKPSGQARVTVDGERIYLGAFNSPASLQRYREIVARWQARQRQQSVPDISIGELVILYNEHVKQHYVKAGKPTVGAALHPGGAADPAGDRAAHPCARLRTEEVKGRAGRDGRRRAGPQVDQQARQPNPAPFKWGVAEEFVPADVLAAISALDGLKAGRSKAAEKLPVLPVSLWDVVAIRKHVPPQVYAMVRLQIRSGARPGEVVRLRTCDLDRRGTTWQYEVAGHKTEHHGRRRVVFIGPRGPADACPVPATGLARRVHLPHPRCPSRKRSHDKVRPQACPWTHATPSGAIARRFNGPARSSAFRFGFPTNCDTRRELLSGKSRIRNDPHRAGTLDGGDE